MSQEFFGRHDGQEGVFVDEQVCEDGCTYISCDIFDEEGMKTFHSEFPRDVSPQEISEFVLISADSVLIDFGDDINLEEAYEIAENLRKHAKKVPGL